jgi:hypothetical protein
MIAIKYIVWGSDVFAIGILYFLQGLLPLKVLHEVLIFHSGVDAIKFIAWDFDISFRRCCN